MTFGFSLRDLCVSASWREIFAFLILIRLGRKINNFRQTVIANYLPPQDPFEQKTPDEDE
jgi:hypothetical protein